MNKIIALVVAIVIVLFAASSTVFVVDQRHMAVLSVAWRLAFHVARARAARQTAAAAANRYAGR